MTEYQDSDYYEEDEGYSIPKILVAVLLLVVIGAGIYIINQNRELKTMFNRYESQKKSIENELEAMILKYNLAIDDNGSLSNELESERDRIIRFRDSIKKVKQNDLKSIEEYKKTITSLRQESSIDLTPTAPITVNKSKVELKNEINPTNGSKSSTGATTTEKTALPDAQVNSNLSNSNDGIEVTETRRTTAGSTPSGTQNFERVEIPPVYPGCTGTIAQQKDCFSRKVNAALNSNFNKEITDNFNLASGRYRVNVGFTIDKFGNIIEVRAKGPNTALESEAVKAAKSLPKMSPARQNGIPVDVSYTIPMTIIIE